MCGVCEWEWPGKGTLKSEMLKHCLSFCVLQQVGLSAGTIFGIYVAQNYQVGKIMCVCVYVCVWGGGSGREGGVVI